MSKAPVPLERAVQIAIKKRLIFHGVICIHIPNAGRRSAAAGRRLKQEGMLPGAPDIIAIGEGGKVAWLEVKRPGYSPSDVSDNQHDMHDTLRRKGHFVAIVTSQDEAVEALRSAGLIR